MRDNRGVEFGLLGPLTAVEGGRDVTPARPKQRALLALLLLRRGEIVPGAVLIEALWGEEPPGTAQTALHGHISALRKLIGSDRIRTRPPGYLMDVSPEEVDLARFEALVARARERDDPAERSVCLREALALWRGEPLAELRGEPFVDREIARLEELRLAALEDRIDADLALGRHHELVPELEPLVAEHVFRERLRGQLMLALYRCGRQAHALQVFQSGRRELVEELGLDPGSALAELELQILRHDTCLDPPARDVQRQTPTRPKPPVRYARSGGLSIADRDGAQLPGDPLGPLVGRAEELERLERALRRTESGVGSTVLVAGDAGIGKTRLVSKLATRARAAGFEARVGRCLDLVGTELPYQPFVEALRPLARRLPFVDGSSAGSQLRVFEETLALIDGVAADAPVLLVLEDLHWADTSTLDLVAYLAHNLGDRRVLLLATYRADESGSADRVRRLADSVGRSGSAVLPDLPALGREDLVARRACGTRSRVTGREGTNGV